MEDPASASNYSTPARPVEELAVMVDEDGLLLSPDGGSDSDTAPAVADLASPAPENLESAIERRRRDLRREVGLMVLVVARSEVHDPAGEVVGDANGMDARWRSAEQGNPMIDASSPARLFPLDRSVNRRHQVRSRARKGVPKCLRGQVWPRMALSCIDASRSNHRARSHISLQLPRSPCISLSSSLPVHPPHSA